MVLRGGTMSVCGKIVKDIKSECHFERVNDVQIVCLRRPAFGKNIWSTSAV